MSEGVDFRRTNNGLATYPDFLRVDVIFYCEGEFIEGASERESILNPDYIDIDHSFWHPIVSMIFFGKRFVIKPVGNKSEVFDHVMGAAEGESSLNVRRTFGLVDRDFIRNEDLFSNPKLLRSKGDIIDEVKVRIIFTIGYSVENDLIAICGIEGLLKSLMPRLPASRQLAYTKSITALKRPFSKIVSIDRVVNDLGYQFISTDDLPSFIDNLEFPRDLSHSRFMELYCRFRAGVLQRQGFQNFSELRQSCNQENVKSYSLSPDGFLDFKGKSLIKALVLIFNNIGQTFPKKKWAKVGDERIVDTLIVEHGRKFPEVLRRTDLVCRPFSWLCKMRDDELLSI